MLLSELVSTDGADFDWTPYLPIIFHTCFINFDNTKQLIGEHSKKLFLNTLYVLTIQTELYGLSDYLLGEFDSVLDNQSIVYDRKYTNNNYVDSTNPVMSSMYNVENRLSQLSVGNCHYSYNYNSNNFSNLNGSLFNELNEKATNRHKQLINMCSAPVSPHQGKNSTTSGNVSSPRNIKQTKKAYRIQKAKECLAIIIGFLSKTKNSPVWPFELITSQNYNKKLTSVQIINELVSNLKLFLTICSNSEIGDGGSMRTGLARSNSLNERVELNLEVVCRKVCFKFLFFFFKKKLQDRRYQPEILIIRNLIFYEKINN